MNSFHNTRGATGVTRALLRHAETNFALAEPVAHMLSTFLDLTASRYGLPNDNTTDFVSSGFANCARLADGIVMSSVAV